MNRLASILIIFITVQANTFPVFAQKMAWNVVETKNTISARSECSLVTVNNKIYLLGGDGPAFPVQEYDPKSTEWIKKSTSPVPLHHFQAIAQNEKIYVLDAFYEGSFPKQEPAPNVWVYNTITDKWFTLKGLSMERRRAGAGAAIYNGKMYLVDGITHGHSSGTNNFFDEFDPKTDTWISLPNAPHIRDHGLAVVVKDKLYAIGGRNTSYKDPQNHLNFFSQVVLDVDCYDFKTQKWTTLAAKLPQGTGGGTAVVIHGIIYYIGGERATPSLPNGPQKDVYFLDPERSNIWRKGPLLNFSRNGVGGTVLGNHIYIAGGVEGPHGPGGAAARRAVRNTNRMRNPDLEDTVIKKAPNNIKPVIGPSAGTPGNEPGIDLETLEVK